VFLHAEHRELSSRGRESDRRRRGRELETLNFVVVGTIVTVVPYSGGVREDGT